MRTSEDATPRTHHRDAHCGEVEWLARQHWQALRGTAMALLIGLLAVALPYWFTPFFAISIR